MASGRKILIAEDEPDLQALMKERVESAGYTVFTASDGKEAVEEANKRRPDLIVLDVMMPVMDGFTALQELKKKRRTREIPVIILTAKSSLEDVQKGMSLYAEQYLTKPFQPEVLLEKIELVFSQFKVPQGKPSFLQGLMKMIRGY